MKSFLLRLGLFFLIFSVVFVLLLSRADGHADAFYLRISSPKQVSLVLGTSRAAQGIRPEAINETLGINNLFNYAFTQVHSPYGPAYFESIKGKLKQSSGKAIFILTVDPWSLSHFKKNNDNLPFIENKNFLAKLSRTDIHPNLEYLLFHYNQPYIDLFRKSEMELHDDGWLEVNISMDSIQIANRIKEKVNFYRDTFAKEYDFSQKRLDYLLQIIRFLRSKGDVYLVRLPIHADFMTLENDYMPDFNNRIKEAIAMSEGYLDMTPKNDEFLYTDGNHLYKDSAWKVSREIAIWISSVSQ